MKLEFTRYELKRILELTGGREERDSCWIDLGVCGEMLGEKVLGFSPLPDDIEKLSIMGSVKK